MTIFFQGSARVRLFWSEYARDENHGDLVCRIGDVVWEKRDFRFQKL